MMMIVSFTGLILAFSRLLARSLVIRAHTSIHDYARLIQCVAINFSIKLDVCMREVAKINNIDVADGVLSAMIASREAIVYNFRDAYGYL